MLMPFLFNHYFETAAYAREVQQFSSRRDKTYNIPEKERLYER